MKLALITDPKGFKVVEMFKMGYHLVLAAEVLQSKAYRDFYREASERGQFILMDNGAAEKGTLSLSDLMKAAEAINADEIVLPDVMGDSAATFRASTNPEVLDAVPPKMRAVVPQGNTVHEWWACANLLAGNMEFATLCIPKHAERFPGGRAGILKLVHKLNWHTTYHIHLLGIWDDPWSEIASLREFRSWVRGIDTALPFALAQHGITLSSERIDHVSHTWGRKFDTALAYNNVNTLWSLVWNYPNASN
jgi:hypothetical protein